jgi:hypothetical protein
MVLAIPALCVMFGFVGIPIIINNFLLHGLDVIMHFLSVNTCRVNTAPIITHDYSLSQFEEVGG